MRRTSRTWNRTTRCAPSNDATSGPSHTISARAATYSKSPLSKSTNSSPARGSCCRFPSVLKKRLPLKSGVVSVRASSTRTKPGIPPRCDTSAPRAAPASADVFALATKNVSACASSARSASFNASDTSGSTDASTSRVTSVGLRPWMYFAQLPKLCSTAIVSTSPSTARTTPLTRLRRRVSNSIPSPPSGAPGCHAPVSGSPGSARAAMRSVRASGDVTNPGAPARSVAHGWPCASTPPSTKNGSCAKNVRCWSGMKRRIPRRPAEPAASVTPARCCTASSPA